MPQHIGVLGCSAEVADHDSPLPTPDATRLPESAALQPAPGD